MITLAERLFAEEGIEAVSMRQVAIGSGQRNNSAVAYHFGSRAGLVRAVLEHRTGPIDARRRELVAELEQASDGRAVTLADTMRVFVQPLAERLADSEPGWYLRFLADATTDPAHDDTQGSTPPPGIAWVNRRVVDLVDAPARVVRRRMRWMVLITLRVLADHERAAAPAPDQPGRPGRPGRPVDVEEIVDDLTRTLTALLDSR
jgi:AcrR family transcriptional regulator